MAINDNQVEDVNFGIIKFNLCHKTFLVLSSGEKLYAMRHEVLMLINDEPFKEPKARRRLKCVSNQSQKIMRCIIIEFKIERLNLTNEFNLK